VRQIGQVTALRCVECERTYRPGEVSYTCPACGRTGILDVEYDYEAVARSGRLTREALAADRSTSIWRYRPLLPLAEPAQLPPVQVGGTPLIQAKRLAEWAGLRHLQIKDEGRNSTGSLKDRPSALCVVRALEEGADTVACASAGNAASSLAGFAASVGLRAVIFVPARTPPAKVAQLLAFGARVFLVKGTYDQAYDLCNEAVARFGWLNRNAAMNPFLVEGKKTVGFEICEQTNWEVPDWVACSVGDGCTIAGAFKAFVEFRRLGLIDRLPKMLGVQVEGCSPLAEAFESGGAVRPVVPETLADSIAVGRPNNATKALRAVRKSGGTFARVPDGAVIEAMGAMGRLAGVFAEPAAATAMAGLRQAAASGLIGPGERVVVMVTGNGLKDVQSAQQIGGQVATVEPELEAVLRTV
jgi:threonine synthase